jgi:hypothetical protein
MWDKCFTPHPPSYKDIFGIEEDIKKFELDLPSSFCLPTLQAATEHPCVLFQVCSTSFGRVHYLNPFFQNRVLTLQIYHARILLLRPFVQHNRDFAFGDEKLSKFQNHAKYVCLMLW